MTNYDGIVDGPYRIFLLKDGLTKIYLLRSSGFCFGVKKAVETAYRLATEAESSECSTYMLGAITHNESVVSDLTGKGIRLADSAGEIAAGGTVIIRAHGVAPQVREALGQKDCRVFDCTCPFVDKIHSIVREADDAGQSVLIVGKKGHPEVDGLCGECKGEHRVISSVLEAEELIWGDQATVMVSQTTFSALEFQKISEIVKNKIAKLKIFDTICSTTANRQREAAVLAALADRMIVIGSAASSNTMKLYDICRSTCAQTHRIADSRDLAEVLPSFSLGTRPQIIGITAGASTPESNIREVIRVMSENEAGSNQEQMEINFGAYVDNIPQLRKNATVRGAITSADNEFVYVDVHDKSEGRIPKSEFASDPDFDLDAAIAEHREVEVFVRSVRNSDMGKEILLSKSHVDYGKYKAILEEAYTNKTPITVKITGVVKDGVIANLGGVDVYIHRTQLEMHAVEKFDEYKDKEIEILITQFDPDRRRLRVAGSRRTLLNMRRKARAEELWSTIEVGAEYDGIVRSLTDFGAFVDIGGVDGLVHVSELSWNRIRHPSEVLSVGDIVHVYVKDFDQAKRRISLGYRREQDDPYFNIEERYPVGTFVHGKVVRLFQFGAFVEIEENLDALCHVSQISSVRISKPGEVLSEGMMVDAVVVDVNSETRRLSISIRDVAPIDPEPVKVEEDLVAEAKEEVSEYVADDSGFQTTSVFEAMNQEDAAPEATEVVSEAEVVEEVEETPVEETTEAPVEVAETVAEAEVAEETDAE